MRHWGAQVFSRTCPLLSTYASRSFSTARVVCCRHSVLHGVYTSRARPRLLAEVRGVFVKGRVEVDKQELVLGKDGQKLPKNIGVANEHNVAAI